MVTGSRRWFGYLSDDNKNYALELDESTYETLALGFSPVSPGADALSLVCDRPIKPRYINVSRVVAPSGPTLRAKFYVGTAATLAAIVAVGSVTVGGVIWNLSSYFGESRKLVPATDTEELDGDIDDNV